MFLFAAKKTPAEVPLPTFIERSFPNTAGCRGQIFADGAFPGKTLVAPQVLREHKRALDKSIRELDRERSALEQQEKKLIVEIKRMAKQNQMASVRVMAKDLIRVRHSITKFHGLKSQLQGVSLKMQTLKSTQAMAEAMRCGRPASPDPPLFMSQGGRFSGWPLTRPVLPPQGRGKGHVGHEQTAQPPDAAADAARIREAKRAHGHDERGAAAPRNSSRGSSAALACFSPPPGTTQPCFQRLTFLRPVLQMMGDAVDDALEGEGDQVRPASPLSRRRERDGTRRRSLSLVSLSCADRPPFTCVFANTSHPAARHLFSHFTGGE